MCASLPSGFALYIERNIPALLLAWQATLFLTRQAILMISQYKQSLLLSGDTDSMSHIAMSKHTSKAKTQLHRPTYLWLSLPVLIGTLIVALAGVWEPAVYGNSDSLAAQGQAQDLITLLVALPVLAFSAWQIMHGHLKARLIWVGAMMYLAYTYAIAAFQVEFNQLFLLYVIILSCSFYAMMLGFNKIQSDEVQLSEQLPYRAVSGIAGFIAVAYYGMWLGDALPAVLDSTPPEAVLKDNIPTSAVHVLDMGFYLPFLVAGAVLLWQRKPLGVIITTIALSFGVLMGLAVAAMVVNLARWDLAESAAPVIIFMVTTSLIGGTLYWLWQHFDM